MLNVTETTVALSNLEEMLFDNEEYLESILGYNYDRLVDVGFNSNSIYIYIINEEGSTWKDSISYAQFYEMLDDLGIDYD